MGMQILAVLAEAVGVKACLEGALAAAMADPDAQIEALHVRVDPDKLARAPEEIAIQHFRERDEGTAETRAHAVHKIYDEWIKAQTPIDAARFHWREEIGAEAEFVEKEAAHADLLVLARPHDMDAHDAMHATLFSSARPLLIPSDWTSKRLGLGAHVVIAWKSTVQAVRAIRGATPWLRLASKITVLIVEVDPSTDSANQVEELLDSLGLVAEIKLCMPVGGEVADQILQFAHDVKADALVMGAYRHNELLEWLLGATTRRVLAKANLPLFLAH